MQAKIDLAEGDKHTCRSYKYSCPSSTTTAACVTEQRAPIDIFNINEDIIGTFYYFSIVVLVKPVYATGNELWYRLARRTFHNLTSIGSFTNGVVTGYNHHHTLSNSLTHE